jgi:hypothetical protein
VPPRCAERLAAIFMMNKVKSTSALGDGFLMDKLVFSPAF